MEEKKSYNLLSSVHDGIIEIVISGEVAINAVEKLQNEVFTAIQSTNIRNVLVDVRNIKGRFGPAEAYFRVRGYLPEQRLFNTAVVDLPENEAFESFHETTGCNAGLSLKCFTNIDSAREWLKHQQSENRILTAGSK
jgi:hypothetical protein